MSAANTRPGRRVLVLGSAAELGSRVVRELERDPSTETLVGVDSVDPAEPFERAEFVRVATDDIVLRRVIRAARIDTIVDTRLHVDGARGDVVHAVNVEGTYAMLAAAGGPDTPVRMIVFRSTDRFYGSGPLAPAFFTESMVPVETPRTVFEHDIALAERALAEFADDHPEIAVTVMRCAPAIGPSTRSAHMSLLSLPVVPGVLGFDPRWQLLHEDDLIGALVHAVRHELQGIYNVAADGVLALSEVGGLLGKVLMPLLPPWGTVFAAIQLRRIGLPVPVELLRELRHGRGLDNRKLKAAGYVHRYTTREALIALRAHQRLRPLLAGGPEGSRYERDVEAFLRWSPSVRGELAASGAAIGAADAEATAGPASGPAASGGSGFSDDAVTEAELIEVIGGLDSGALTELRAHEAAGRGRPRILGAIDEQLARL